MSKKLPFSRSLCPFCAALEREQNSVDSKISAGASGLRGTGKRSGKGARFPSAWREQALVSGVSMDRGKQISPFKANHAVLEGTHWRQCAAGSGAAGKGLGGRGKAEGRRATEAKSQWPCPCCIHGAPQSPGKGAGKHWSIRRLLGWGRWGTHMCSYFVLSLPSPPAVMVCAVKERGSTQQLPDLLPTLATVTVYNSLHPESL